MFDTVTTETATTALVVPVSLGELITVEEDVTTEERDALVVAEGREAWGRIKSNAKMMREDWRKVGEALLVGRKANRSDKRFGQWLQSNFPDLSGKEHKDTRANAMWLAENWSTVALRDSSLDLCHPTNVRAAYNKAQTGAESQEPQELPKPTPPKASGDLPWEEGDPPMPANPIKTTGEKPSGAAQPRAKPTSEGLCTMLFLVLCDLQETGKFDTAHLRERLDLLKPGTIDTLINSLVELKEQI